MPDNPSRLLKLLAAVAATIMTGTLASPAFAAPTVSPTPTPTVAETPSAEESGAGESGADLDPETDDGRYDPPTEDELEQAPDATPEPVDPSDIPVVDIEPHAIAPACPNVTFGVAGASFTDGWNPDGRISNDGDGIEGTYMHERNAISTSWAHYTTRDPYLFLDGGWAKGGSTVGDLANKIRPHMYRSSSYVVIFAGTNDQLRGVSAERSMQHMATLVENTGVAKNRILLVTLPPIRHLEQRVITYNEHLAEFGRRNGIRVLDVHTMNANGAHWRDGHTYDGIHFNLPQAKAVGDSIAHTLNDMTGCVRSDFGAEAARAQLGAARTGIHVGLRDYGKFQHFDIGSVYVSNVSPSTSVRGAIRDEWARMGWENGYPGYPIEPERCGFVRGGCYSVFERSSIYWSPATGAVEINGATRDHWGRLGWERGWLGYPTHTKYCGLIRGGCLQRFEGGVMYWTSRTGSHAVRGKIFEHWGTSGWERGHLGYPTTDEHCGLIRGGCFTHFEGGSIYWSPGTGAHTVKGRIKDAWAAGGWERGRLGYPVTSERCDRVGCTQEFQGGRMVFRWDTGRAVPHHR